MENRSGIYPVGDRVLIKPDSTEEVSEGGIVLVKETQDQARMATSTGTVTATGPDCWVDWIERSSDGTTKQRGFAGPFCKVGDRVSFGKYAGLQMGGKDGEEYRLINDTDVTAVVDEGVDFTDWKPRKPMGQ